MLNRKKINKAKSWFFGRTNKSDKPLARMIRKRQSTSYQYKKKFKGDITTELSDNNDIMNHFICINWKVWVA